MIDFNDFEYAVIVSISNKTLVSENGLSFLNIITGFKKSPKNVVNGKSICLGIVQNLLTPISISSATIESILDLPFSRQQQSTSNTKNVILVHKVYKSIVSSATILLLLF